MEGVEERSVFLVVEDLMEERERLHFTILILAVTTILLALLLLASALAICFLRQKPRHGAVREGRAAVRRRPGVQRRGATPLYLHRSPSPCSSEYSDYSFGQSSLQPIFLNPRV